MDNNEKKVIGLIERVKVIGIKEKEVSAKIDTGADISSMDIHLASELQLGPILDTKKIISSVGKSVRPIIKATIVIKNKRIKARFNLSDRQNMKYKLLLGKNILKRGFLIDPSKK